MPSMQEHVGEEYAQEMSRRDCGKLEILDQALAYLHRVDPDLTLTQARILIKASMSSPVRSTQLSKDLGLPSPQYASRNLIRMTKLDMPFLEPGPLDWDNRRASTYVATPYLVTVMRELSREIL